MRVAGCVEDRAPAGANTCRHTWPVRNYDLAATLNSGQAFRWEPRDGGWEGIVATRWVRLTASSHALIAETAVPPPDWDWLARYLRLDDDLDAILATFPDDAPLRAAVAACRGLRLLRQDPWECLATFILSSTKRITHIRRIVATLCRRFGEPVPVPAGREPGFAFPPPARLAARTEAELRGCGMGFRAPYLLAAARHVAAGELDLARLGQQALAEARAALMTLPGVGRKIADCVLLFAGGFDAAFPVDVWVGKALRELYFRRRRPPPRRLLAFTETRFGPYAGYAQQYLFHYRRTRAD
jgi:N-glycosylase/DNA lyase